MMRVKEYEATDKEGACAACGKDNFKKFIILKGNVICKSCYIPYEGEEIVFENYTDYLKSETWQQKRIKALTNAFGRCQVCASDEQLHVHHRQYTGRWGEEHPEDLTVLCKNCHELFHETENHRLIGSVSMKVAIERTLSNLRKPR